MLDVLSLRKKDPASLIYMSEDFSTYSAALHFYWNKDYQSCLDLVFSALSGDQNLASSGRFYRLWIETLAEQFDKKGLRQLNAHLLCLGEAEGKNDPWLGLRGLIHLELDEWEACELLNQILADSDSDCPYALEFVQRCRFRTDAEARLDRIDLLKSTLTPQDYFSWLSLAKALLLAGSEKELFASLSCAVKMFAGAPIEDEYFAYLYLDEQNLDEANSNAQKLRQNFPNNLDFLYLLGYIQRSRGDLKAAIKTFSHGKELAPNDADIFAELSYCHLEKAEKDVYSSHWQKAKDYGNHAAELYKKLGLPATQISCQVAEQERYEHDFLDASGELSQEMASPQFWLLELKASVYQEFNSYDDEEVVRIFRAVPPKASQGDLVFLTAMHPLYPHTWRMLAVYQVASKLVWHPYERQQAGLLLRLRLEDPVLIGKIDLALSERRHVRRFDDPATFSMLELDEDAFDVLRRVILESSSVEEPLDLSKFYRKSS